VTRKAGETEVSSEIFFAQSPPKLSTFWKIVTKDKRFMGRSNGVAENYTPCASQMKQVFTRLRGCRYQDYRFCCSKSIEFPEVWKDKTKMQGNKTGLLSLILFWEICFDEPNDIVSVFGSYGEYFATSLLLYIYKPFRLNVSFQTLCSWVYCGILWLFVVPGMALPIPCIFAIESLPNLLFSTICFRQNFPLPLKNFKLSDACRT
jgi:hypothetical protein